MSLKYIYLVIMVFCGVISSYSQARDTVFLNNGDIICGTIVKNVAGESISIRRADNLIFTIMHKEIKSIIQSSTFSYTLQQSDPDIFLEPNSDVAFQISVSGISSFPDGIIGNIAGSGVGGIVSGEYLLNNTNMIFSFSVGFISWAKKNHWGHISDSRYDRYWDVEGSLSAIPLKFGYKYYYSLDNIIPFIQIESGVFIFENKSKYYSSYHDNVLHSSFFDPSNDYIPEEYKISTKFMVSAKIGTVIKTGLVDLLISVSYEGFAQQYPHFTEIGIGALIPINW